MQWPLSILIYHRVLAEPDPLFPGEVDAARFSRQLGLMKRWFNVLPLRVAVQRLAEGDLPARAACITFDDGYADNELVALPILQKWQLPATFFIASGFLGGGQMWNDAVIELVRTAPGPLLDLSRCGFGRFDVSTLALRRIAIEMLIAHLKHLPPLERLNRVRSMTPNVTPSMLSHEQLIRLHRSGMEIGAHTVSHPILSALSESGARAEIETGRRQLENIIQAKVSTFAYPNGKPGLDFEARDVRLVRELGFEAAVTTTWGAAREGCDPFLLPRFTPWDRGAAGFLLRMGQNLLRRPV